MSSIDIKLKIDTTEARKGVEDFANSLKKAENSTNGASESIGSSIKTIREEIRKQMEATKNSITSFTTQIAEEKAVIKGIAADVANLQKSFDKTAPGKQRGGIESELNAAKKALEEEKAALASLEEQQRSARITLGDLKQQYSGYTAQIKEASEKNKQYASIFKMLPQPIQGVVTATKNLTKASLAFITTPLGAVLMLLVGAYQAVSTWATYSKEGQDALAASSAYLSGIMNSLREIVIDAGKAIYMAFNDPKQAVINLWESIKKNLVKRVEGLGEIFKSLGKIISSGFTSGYGDLADAFIQVNTGVEDFSKKAKNYIENAQEMAEKTKKLQQEETKLNDAQREASKKLAEYDKKIAEAREKSTNQELSNTERKKATEEAKQLIKEKYDLEKKLSEEELRVQRERMKLTTNTNQDYDKEAALEVRLLKLEAERENQLKALNRTSGSVSKEIISAQKASANATIELELKAQRERLAVLEDSKDKSIALIEIETKERLAAIDKEEKALTEKNKKAGISGLTKEQSETFTVRRKVVSDNAAKKRFDIEYQYNTETEKLYEQLTDVFLTEEERKTKAVQERYDEMRKMAKEEYDNTVSAINITKQGSDRDAAIKQATDKYNETNTLIDTAQAREELNAVLEEYKGFQQQRVEIEEKYNNDIQKLQEQLTKSTDEEEKKRLQESIKVAQKNQEKALSDLSLSMLKETDLWTRLFSDTSDHTNKYISQIIADTEQLIDYMNGVEGVEIPIGFTKEQIESLKKDPEKVKSILEQLKKQKDELNTRNPFSSLLQGFQDLVNAGSDTEKQMAAINTVIGAMNGASAIINQVGDALDSMGLKAGSAMKDVASVINDTASLASTGASLGGPIGAAVGAGLGLATSVIKLFSGKKDKKHDNQIAAIQKQIDSMDKEYSKLQEKTSSSYSGKKAASIDAESENLRKQNELIQQQIQEEQAKKKTDQGKIDQWNEAIEANNALIEKNKDLRIDAIMGSDIQSAIDDFANAYIEAWEAGDKAAGKSKDVVKKMIKGIITELLKSNLQPSVENFRKKLVDAMADNYISGTEQAELDRLQAEMERIADNTLAGTEKYFQDNEVKTPNSQTGAISETIKESTASEMTGIWRGQYDTLKGIYTVNSSFYESYKSTMSICNGILNQIADNTGRTAENTTVLTGMNDTLNRMDERLRTMENNSNKKYA